MTNFRADQASNRASSSSLWASPSTEDLRISRMGEERKRERENCFNGRTIKKLGEVGNEKANVGFLRGEEFLGGISRRNFLARRGGVNTPYFRRFSVWEGRGASRLVEHCQNERCNGCIFEFTSWNWCAGQQPETEWKRFLSCPSVIDLRVYDRGLWAYVTLPGRRRNSSLSKCMEGDTAEVMVNGLIRSNDLEFGWEEEEVRNSVLNGLWTVVKRFENFLDKFSLKRYDTRNRIIIDRIIFSIER